MAERLQLSPEEMKGLVERKLPWPKLKEIMSSRKDPARFETYLQVLQSMVPWEEPIVLPIHEHLFIVNQNGSLVVKAWCGQGLGDYRENWKLKTLIYVRDTEEKFAEVFLAPTTFEPNVVEIREFYCPGCGNLLDVECVPPGHPIAFDFLPDLETFYRDWLGRDLPEGVNEARFEDRSTEVIRSWTPGRQVQG